MRQIIPLAILISSVCFYTNALGASRKSEAGSALSLINEPGRKNRPPQKAEPWIKWATDPLNVKLSFQAVNVYAATNTTVQIKLAGSVVTINGRSCTDPTNGPVAGSSLNLRKEYLLTVIASNLQSMELDLNLIPGWQPFSKTGRASVPKQYALFVDRVPATGVTSNQMYISTNCAYYSNVFRVEVRDEKLFHWYLDDRSDDQSSAAGDGTTIELGPGKSINTNETAMDWSVSLGRLFDGSAAGRLQVREGGLSRRIYTPTNIFYTASSTNARSQVELVTSSADGVLRQVKALQTFVDLVAATDQTTLNFYRPSQVATNKDQNGVYTNISGSPFVAWIIQNPEPSTTNKLYIIESRNGLSRTNSLIFDPQSSVNTWTLKYGTGADERAEIRGVTFTSSPLTNRIETLLIKYASSNSPAYKCIETYQLFGWGWDLAKTQVDPDGSNLVTTIEYYTNSADTLTFGKPMSFRYPDGYWEKRLYDTNYFLGALEYVLRPDKDTPSDPTNATLQNCYVAQYIYSATYLRLQSIYHFYGGTDHTNQFRQDEIMSMPSGSFVLSSESRYVAADLTYALGLFTILADEGQENGLANHPLFHEDDRGPRMTMYYHGGTYDPSLRTFTTNSSTVSAGPDWRQSVISYGYPEHLETSENDLITVTSVEGQTLWENYYSPGVPLEPNKSYKEARIFQSGSLVHRDLSVFTGTNGAGVPLFDLYQSFVYKNDSLGHATNITRYDAANPSVSRIIYEADYKASASNDGDLLLSETDESGIRTEYSYDSLKRVVTVTKKGVAASGGFPAQADIATGTRFDATGKTIERSLTSGALSLTNKSTYDLAGRLITSTDEKGLVTSLLYELGGRKITTSLPSGATDVRENYLDRRLHNRTGTGTVQETHDYWQWAQGTDTTFMERVTLQEKISYGTNSLRWKKIGTDWFGVPVRSESPDYVTTNSVIHHEILSKNLDHPWRIRETGQPNHYLLLDYDGAIGKVTVGDGELASTARISRTLKQFVKQGSAWFKVQTNLVYLVDNDATPTIASISQERLSGFSSSTTSAEITTWDADTNATVQTTYIDRTNKKFTQVVDTAQSTLNATNITINGLLQAESSVSVASPVRHYYDGLGRETSVVSSLGFTSYQNYDQSGQLTSVIDSAGNQTSYAYYPSGVTGAGQVKSETRSNGKTTYYAYTFRGERFRTWGDVPYPEQRLHNDYGEMAELHTFQSGSGWNGSSWPGSPGTTNKTIWSYQPESGLLLSKTDDAARSVTYTYESGRLLTRTWARGVTVTNTYNDFGDVIKLEYSDGTLPVSFNNLSRAGLARQIVDATGTNNLTYDHANRQISSTGGAGIYNSVVVSNHINGIYGRDQIKITGLSSTIQHDYGYDTYGRLGTVTSGSYSGTYGYLPNSDLLQTTTCKSNTTTVLTTTKRGRFLVLTSFLSSFSLPRHGQKTKDPIRRRPLSRHESW